VRKTGAGRGRHVRHARGLPLGEVALDQHQLGRIERGEDREQVFGVRVGGQAEFAGGEIEPGGVQAGLSSDSAQR